MATRKTYPFEESLARLEQLVQKMESGELSLEDSLKTFEEGIRLTRECQKALKDAEQKVRMLTEKNGDVEETPLDSESGQDD
ncbi:MAG TPA: exodeoxyribonuclease VII small subunit [Pseudomonadales bacterium]|nr:exodeoxyribonuclease VII small subunit [Pseudomonadales bacterium]